jgi:hypothetical protein
VQRCLRLENSGTRIYDLILGLPDDRIRLAEHLNEAVRWLWLVQVECREADVELEALRSSVTRVWDLVLEGYERMSSLVTSLSSVAELIEGRVNAAATNEVHWWGPNRH